MTRVVVFSDTEEEVVDLTLPVPRAVRFAAHHYSMRYALVRAIYGHLEASGADVITITKKEF